MLEILCDLLCTFFVFGFFLLRACFSDLEQAVVACFKINLVECSSAVRREKLSDTVSGPRSFSLWTLEIKTILTLSLLLFLT